MQRITTAAIAAILILTLAATAACSSNEEPDDADATSVAPTIPADITVTASPTGTAPQNSQPPEPARNWPRPTDRSSWLASQHPELQRQIAALPWVADGIHPHEQAVMHAIIDAAALHPPLAQNLIHRPWFRDGLDPLEQTIITTLVLIASTDRSLSQEIAAMPFLYVPSPADVIILQATTDIIDARRVVALTQSPMYQQGITDEHAPALSAAAAAQGKGEVAQRYFRQQAIVTETHDFLDTIPPFTATIMRRKGANADPATATHIREAVTAVESIMGLPIAQRHIIIAFDAALVEVATPATQHRNIIAIRDERVRSREEGRLNLLYHEIARQWWTGNADWIDEGMTRTIANIASRQDEANWLARPLPRHNCQLPNIAALDQRPPEASQGAYYCNHMLGEALFRDLLDAMTQESFTAAARALSQSRPADISHVRAAFPSHHDIIDYHYQGDRNAPHRWEPDDAIDIPHHDAIEWQTKPSHSAGTVRLSGTLRPPAVLAAPDLAFTLSDRRRTIATIMSPTYEPTAERPPAATRPINADRMVTNNDGFQIEFTWPDYAGAPEGKAITVWGYRRPDAGPVIGQTADPLTISFIRPDPNPPRAGDASPTRSHATAAPPTQQPVAAATPSPTPLPTLSPLQQRLQNPSFESLLALEPTSVITLRGCHLAPTQAQRRFHLVTWDSWQPQRYGEEMNLVRVVTSTGGQITLEQGRCYQITATKQVNTPDGYACLDPDALHPQHKPCANPRQDENIPVFIMNDDRHRPVPIN